MTPESEAIKINVTTIDIDGATALPKADLDALAAPLVAKHQETLADIYRLADAITVKYREAGFVLSSAVVPAQRIANGFVRIQVIEGYIDHITIEGLDKDDPMFGTVWNIAERVTAARPARVQDIERAMLLINDLAGIKARAVLRPSDGGVGAAEMMVVVERKLTDTSFSIDTYGTKYIGPYQMLGQASLNSAAGLGEKLTVRALGNEGHGLMRYGQLAGELPIMDGLVLKASVAQARATPDYVLHPLLIKTENTAADFGVAFPLVRSRPENVTLGVTYHMRDVSTDMLGSRYQSENVRSLSTNATWDFADPVGGMTLIGLTGTQGLAVMGATPRGSAMLSRPEASPWFTKVNPEILHHQPFDDHITLVLGAEGQVTPYTLYGSEQYSLGGKLYGRGYDSGELTGDDAVAGKVELHYVDAPDLTALKSWDAYGFYDLGRVWNLDRASKGTKNESSFLASAGLGVQAKPEDWITAKLEASKPLDRVVATQLLAGKHTKDPRVFMTLTVAF